MCVWNWTIVRFLYKDIRPTADLNEGFSEVNWALLVGSVPRKAEWSEEPLGINGKIFTGQGQRFRQMPHPASGFGCG